MQCLGNSIYLKCFLLLLLSRLIPSVKVLIAAWAMCMISLQHGCIRKSHTDISNNGTFLLLSVTWLQQELCKFPAIKFWQVAGNQSNMLYLSHIHSIAWKKTPPRSISWHWPIWSTGWSTGNVWYWTGLCDAREYVSHHVSLMRTRINMNLLTITFSSSSPKAFNHLTITSYLFITFLPYIHIEGHLDFAFGGLQSTLNSVGSQIAKLYNPRFWCCEERAKKERLSLLCSCAAVLWCFNSIP